MTEDHKLTSRTIMPRWLWEEVPECKENTVRQMRHNVALTAIDTGFLLTAMPTVTTRVIPAKESASAHGDVIEVTVEAPAERAEEQPELQAGSRP